MNRSQLERIKSIYDNNPENTNIINGIIKGYSIVINELESEIK